MASNKLIGSLVGGAAWEPAGLIIDLFVGHLLDVRIRQALMPPRRFGSFVSERGIRTNAYGEIEE